MNCALPAYTKRDMAPAANGCKPAFCARIPKARPMGIYPRQIGQAAFTPSLKAVGGPVWSSIPLVTFSVSSRSHTGAAALASGPLFEGITRLTPRNEFPYDREDFTETVRFPDKRRGTGVQHLLSSFIIRITAGDDDFYIRLNIPEPMETCEPRQCPACPGPV